MADNLQIGFSDEFNFGNNIIKFEISADRKLGLYVEDCALALGVSKVQKRKTGEFTNVRWERVYEDLQAIDVVPNSGNWSHLSVDEKDEFKKMTISESSLYKWSFRVGTTQGKEFVDWLATVVLPNLREHGIYVTGMEHMNAEEIKLAVEERTQAYVLRKFGITIRKSLTDAIKRHINPRPEEAYLYGQYTNIIYRALFDMDCNGCKEQLGITNESFRDTLRDNSMSKEINDIIEAEKFMCNLFDAGVTDINIITTMMNTWSNSRVIQVVKE